MTKYAARTEVPSSRSRNEIERVLTRYGATSFMSGWDEGQAVIGFVIHDRQVRFVLPLPDPQDRAFTRSETGRARSAAVAQKAYEQAVRSAWRSLLLIIKAKLEAVESGIVEFDTEFLANLVLPNGQTVGSQVLPAARQAMESGSLLELTQ